jgi:hypothetical protein
MKFITTAARLSALAFAIATAPAMAGVIYSQDFEGATPGWTFNSYWHVTSNAPASGSKALGFVFGETAGPNPNGSYAGTNGAQFNAFSNQISLIGTNNRLHFDARVDDEIGDSPEGYDRLSVGISLDGITFGTVIASSPPQNAGALIAENVGYRNYDLDLSAFANKNIYLAFGFATFDGVDDAHPGARIDNLSITGNVIPEPSSIALVGLGLAGVGWSRKKKAS